MNVRADRSIFSYAKVQRLVGNLIRGKSSFIKKERVKDKVLLNIGCGPFGKEEFFNIDYEWRPGLDACWDITSKPYPVQDASLEGIFTEHCLEHIPYEKTFENLKEFYRMLKPGGTVRIIVPDGELYFNLYQARKTDPSVRLPYDDNEDTPMISVNRIFRSHGHLFIYDFETFRMNLEKIGFRNVKKETFRSGRDSRLLIDRPEREIESLYLEATK